MCRTKYENLEEANFNERIKQILSFFKEEEIEKIKSHRKIDNYEHPLKNIIIYDESKTSSNIADDKSSIIYKTNWAFEVVQRIDPDWLRAKKSDLLDDDYSIVSSVLGGIRAYAEIKTRLYRELFNDTSQLVSIPTSKNPTPDFRLSDTDYYQKKYVVDFEVFTKTHDKESQKGIDLGTTVTKINGGRNKITTRVSSHRPFSFEKRPLEKNKHASDLRHIIHLFTQVKAKDKQFSDENINVLWIDMQDEAIFHYSSFLSFASPTVIRDGSFISSTLWHAFYGQIEMIILHEFFQGEHNTYLTSKLEHDGRFYLSENKADFVVFVFPRKTIVFEKPDNDKVIPERFRDTLTYLLNFNSVESRIDFPKGNLSQALKNDVESLEILYKYLKERDEWEE
ncbi:hypothetical protein [Haploplasma axanthum]|uniref:Uncharacterized protein n=1 Tax=Haploplasma axanthum TaxID=29552 RepID=A0A449BFK3_HAPAX|nr:hypothetical protein [Haploplasma axanthum]VEU81090.1 Uncharacterised protein [Haploplasma axanthum]